MSSRYAGSKVKIRTVSGLVLRLAALEKIVYDLVVSQRAAARQSEVEYKKIIDRLRGLGVIIIDDEVTK